MSGPLPGRLLYRTLAIHGGDRYTVFDVVRAADGRILRREQGLRVVPKDGTRQVWTAHPLAERLN